jgi:hypothetical protein
MKNPLIKNLDNFWKTFLKPPRFFHWKMLLILTLLLGIAAVLTMNYIEWQETFITWGYLSFIATLSVFFKEKPLKFQRFSLHPWLLGGLISLFFYYNFSGENLTEFALLAFPLFSVCIASIYEIWESGVQWQVSIPLIRADFIIFILIHCLISFWIRFNILIEHWLKDYPSVFAEEFNKKALVIKIKSSSINDSRGIVIIKTMEDYLILKSDKKPWNEVEKWIFNMGQNRLNLRDEGWKNLGKLPEDSLWKFTYNLQQSQSDYKLQLFAQWYGPRSRTYGYYVTKTCHIFRNRDRASIECSPVKAKDETEPREQK